MNRTPSHVTKSKPCGVPLPSPSSIHMLGHTLELSDLNENDMWEISHDVDDQDSRITSVGGVLRAVIGIALASFGQFNESCFRRFQLAVCSRIKTRATALRNLLVAVVTGLHQIADHG